MEDLDFQTILKLFSASDTSQPTLLEICKYPYNRFEEVCSRILTFFLNPKAEHGFHDLWLSALWKAIGQSVSLPICDPMDCKTEEYAQDKRIDIVVSSCNFAIGIENKITADLYNPLKVYLDHLKNFYGNVNPDNIKMIVLSVFPIPHDKVKEVISDVDDEDKLKFITYKDLFAAVNDKLRYYIMGCDQKYLTFMLDFMKTIENMGSKQNEEIHAFFLEHCDTAKRMIEKFNEFEQEILSDQRVNMNKLKDTLNEKTEPRWWNWHGNDLGISFNDDADRIGIESSYIVSKEGPCAKFKIVITTWDRKCWEPYAQKISQTFPKGHYDDSTPGRINYELYEINGKDKEKEIVDSLSDTYSKMKKIAEEYRSDHKK